MTYSFRNAIKQLTAIGCSGFIILSGTACSSSNTAGPAASWSPPAFPTVDASGVVVPKGPHEIALKITGPNSEVKGEGYIDIAQEGSCALDVTLQEVDKSTGVETSYSITKAPTGPAYISTDEIVWLDTRDPGSPLSPLLTFTNPIGISLSGNTQYQSLCFLSAMPALTGPSLTTGEYPWDQAGIQAFVDASNQSFVSEVLRLAGASPEEFTRVGAAVVELAGLPASEFTTSASLVQVAEKTDSTTISYFIGFEQAVKVELVLTPTTEKIISPPSGAQSWEDEIMEIGEAAGVEGVLQRYFAVS